MQIHTKKLTLIGGITYLSLIFLAIVFYQERVIIFDMSFHTFEIVRSENFAIQYQRFGAVFTQIFPLIAVKLHLSLKAVMILYSAAFVIYHFSAFLISLFLLKNEKLALVILLFSTLLVTHTFYWIQSEFIQGCIFLLLFYGFLLKKENVRSLSITDWVILLAMIITLVFFHPLIAIPFGFMAIFFLLSYAKTNHRLIFISILLFGITLAAKSIFFPPKGYDANRMSTLKYFTDLFPDYFTLSINKKFLRYCLRDYYFLPIFLIITSAFYIRQKNIKKLFLILAFFFGYLLLINVTTYQWPEQFYLESFYLCLSLFVVIPLVFDIMPKINKEKLFYTSLILILLIRVIHIGFSNTKYSARLNWNKKFLSETEKYPSKKLILDKSMVPMNILKLQWSSPYEFLLLSSLDQPKNSRCIIIDYDPKRFNWAMKKNKTFFTPWGLIDYKDLPKEYFDLRDTSYYKIATQGYGVN
ncbi:MAG: hypothetical protein K2X86_05010 [Cytophagaceae bacterium]|nr:hypothetical protein [Cytophagaceae bacterium]